MLARDYSGLRAHAPAAVRVARRGDSLRGRDRLRDRGRGRFRHQVARTTDISAARVAVCAAARQCAGASFALLLESEAGHLVATASSGSTPEPQLEVKIGEEPSGAAAAFLSRQPIFVADLNDQGAVADPVVQETGVVSMHFEPILGEPDPIGVLALGWNERTEALSEHVAGAMRTLAAEAAIALERAALLASLEESARIDDLTTPAALVGCADTALYDAKRAGRNRVVSARPA